MTSTPSPRTTDASVPFTLAVSVALLASAVVNFVGFSFFPGNAPVEQIYSLGITVDLAAAGGVLFIYGMIQRIRPRAVGVPRVRVLSIIAAPLALLTAAGTALLGGFGYFMAAVDGGSLRYMEATFGVFLLGIPWTLAFIFGTIGFRRGGGTVNSILSLGAVIVAFLVLVCVVTPGVIYGLGLSA